MFFLIFRILLNQIKQRVKNMFYVILAFIGDLNIKKNLLKRLGQIYLHLTLLDVLTHLKFTSWCRLVV